MLLFKTQSYSKPKCHNLQNVELIFVCVQKTTQTGLRIFLQTRMVDGAKFNCHDSGSYYVACQKSLMKETRKFVKELNLQVRLKMQSLHKIYTTDGIKKILKI